MTDNLATQADTLNERQIVDWLRQHPDFFERHDDLLLDLKLPHESGRAISLIERQVHVFREQRDRLHRELVDLISIARQNDRIFDKTKRLLMQLLEAGSLDAIAMVLDDSIRQDFGLAAASLLLFTEAALPGEGEGTLHRANLTDARAVLGGMLEGQKATAGQFRRAQTNLLFPAHKTQIASAAVIPLRFGELLGVFAVGSLEANYFDSGMGSLFLSYISDTISRMLPPLLKQVEAG